MAVSRGRRTKTEQRSTASVSYPSPGSSQERERSRHGLCGGRVVVYATGVSFNRRFLMRRVSRTGILQVFFSANAARTWVRRPRSSDGRLGSFQERTQHVQGCETRNQRNGEQQKDQGQHQHTRKQHTRDVRRTGPLRIAAPACLFSLLCCVSEANHVTRRGAAVLCAWYSTDGVCSEDPTP